jgi:Fur family transcriptional regulator, ferric uptake regulator
MPQLQEISKDLKLAGHRLTSPRQRILSVIRASAGHITAEQILKRVRARYGATNKSSVYRTLDLLTRLNLINPTDFGNGRIEYEIHRHPHHHHLLCRDCGGMMEVDEEVFTPLEKTLRTEYRFRANLEHFVIYGLCRACGDHAAETRRTPKSKRGTPRK